MKPPNDWSPCRWANGGHDWVENGGLLKGLHRCTKCGVIVAWDTQDA